VRSNHFPDYDGCSACYAHICAEGETRLAAYSFRIYQEALADYPETEGTGRVAGLKRIKNAAVRAKFAQREFDAHKCENKAEKQAHVDRVRTRPDPGA
tara:strand:+ start:2995 stop:3288 length:294 start_codon:yes stop_codon:yes gene_type:complete